MNQGEFDRLEEPDLQIAGLRIWIHGRQFPEDMDYWDGNWLRVTAICTYPQTTVRAHGPIIHLGEVVAFLRECEILYKTLKGHASLSCIEPNLGVKFTAETGGQILIAIMITPDHMKESHDFKDSFDQTYLPQIITACKQILEKYPVREAEKLPK